MQDEVNMFHGQVALEESVLATAEKDFIFCDTTILTVKIWSDEMLGETPKIVLDALTDRTYDLYLLLNIDLPWEEDPLREFPHMREHFMNVWYKELNNLGARYVLISGIEDRLQNAIDAVDAFLTEKGQSEIQS
jgi:nicotinamide riboside kinase